MHAVRRSGTGAERINQVTLRRARLVLRWVTRSWVYCLDVVSHLRQLSLLPSVGWEMSTSQSGVKVCGWGVKAYMAHSTC